MRYKKIVFAKTPKKKQVEEVIDTCECGCGTKLKSSWKRNNRDAVCVENFYWPNTAQYIGKKIMFFATKECYENTVKVQRPNT